MDTHTKKTGMKKVLRSIPPLKQCTFAEFIHFLQFFHFFDRPTDHPKKVDLEALLMELDKWLNIGTAAGLTPIQNQN